MAYFVKFHFTLGPPITWTFERQATELNVTDMSVGPFGLKSPLLSTYHQQVWLIAKVDTAKREGESGQGFCKSVAIVANFISPWDSIC